MKKLFSPKASLIIAVSVIALAGCFDDNNNNSSDKRTLAGIPTTPVSDDGPPQDQVGAGFAASFNQSPTDEPTDPMSGDIIALDKTAEPIEIPDP